MLILTVDVNRVLVPTDLAAGPEKLQVFFKRTDSLSYQNVKQQ